MLGYWIVSSVTIQRAHLAEPVHNPADRRRVEEAHGGSQYAPEQVFKHAPRGSDRHKINENLPAVHSHDNRKVYNRVNPQIIVLRRRAERSGAERSEIVRIFIEAREQEQ